MDNKIYLPLPNETQGRELKLQIMYFKGRGYAVSVTRVKRKKEEHYTSESYMMFDGYSMMILPCDRKSSKREAEAISIMNSRQQEFFDKYCVEILPKQKDY